MGPVILVVILQFILSCKLSVHTEVLLLSNYTNFSSCILSCLTRCRLAWLTTLSEEEQHFLFELMERRHDGTSTIFCTQYRREDWHARLGGGVHADAIMDRIVHNAVWIETGSMNMREFYSKSR